MNPRRTLAALLAPLALATAAEARADDPPQRIAQQEIEAAEAEAARLREQQSVLGEDGMVAAVEIEGVRLGIGRFTASPLARPRDWTERERDPADFRPRERGIAAVGIRIPF